VVNVIGGSGGSGTSTGGAVNVTGGAGGASGGDGGNINIDGGTATAGTSNGGNVVITSGSPALGGQPGDVIINAADAATNQTPDGGQVVIRTGDGGTGTGTGAGGDFTVECGIGGVGGTSTGLGGSIVMSAGRGGVGGTLAHGGRVDITAGDGISTSSDGGHVTITAGDGERTSGSVFINAGVTGAPGGIVMVTERDTAVSGTQSAITKNTQPGFVGQEHEFMTAAVSLAASATNTPISIPGPSAEGRNVKVVLWATGDASTGGAGHVLSQITEQVFYRVGGVVTALAANRNSTVTVGTMTGTAVLTIVGGDIDIVLTADSTNTTNYSLYVEWQDGGLAS
jgi:hypothetical protein